MSAWLLFHEPDSLPRKHLVTPGLGAGSLTKFAHRVLGMQASAVEIDAGVIAACRGHFMLPPDGDGLRVVHGDAAEYMAQPAVRRSIDVLQVDAYTAAVETPALDTQAFYADCRTGLREGGTVAVNLIRRAGWRWHGARRRLERHRPGDFAPAGPGSWLSAHSYATGDAGPTQRVDGCPYARALHAEGPRRKGNRNEFARERSGTVAVHLR